MLDKTKVVDLDRLPRQLFIGGEWVDGVDGGRISIVNPFNNEELFEIAEAKNLSSSHFSDSVEWPFHIQITQSASRQ